MVMRIHKTPFIRATVTLVLVLPFLAACSGLLDSEQPAKQYFLLQPLDESSSPHAVELELKVVPGLDTDRIQGLAGDASLHRYENARWPDNLPEVLQSVMQRSLDGADAGENDPLAVNLEVQEFFGRMNGSGETHSVRVKIAGTVTCKNQSHRIELSASPNVISQNLASIVAAHQAGLDEVTRQLLRKLESRCG